MRINVYYQDYEFLQEIVEDYCLFHESFEMGIVSCSQEKLLHNVEITKSQLEIYILQLNTDTDDAFAERLRILNSMAKIIIVPSLRRVHQLIHRHIEIYDYLVLDEQLDVRLRLQQSLDELQEMCCR